MSAAEGRQHDGIEGVRAAKRLLESTTWIELGFDVYRNQAACSLELLSGTVKAYDLFGQFLDDHPRPVYVEVKNYTTQSGLKDHYEEFVINSYSAMALRHSKGDDSPVHFMFVTKHPFAITNWSTLTSNSTISHILHKHQDDTKAEKQQLEGHSIDDDIISQLHEHLWLIVWHDKQEKLALTPAELAAIEPTLKRKVPL